MHDDGSFEFCSRRNKEKKITIVEKYLCFTCENQLNVTRKECRAENSAMEAVWGELRVIPHIVLLSTAALSCQAVTYVINFYNVAQVQYHA